VHYHFVDKESMEAGIARGDFIEHANVHGNFYGTSKVSQNDGPWCISTEMSIRSALCLIMIQHKIQKSVRGMNLLATVAAWLLHVLPVRYGTLP
jgi:hypothetical protein